MSTSSISENEQTLRPRYRRWRSFTRNRAAMAGLVVLVTMTVVHVGGYPWASRTYDQLQLGVQYAAPSAEHWLGTDALGRDYLARMIYGGRLSLSVGLMAAGIAVVIGTAWGSVAGFVGGRVDALMMRFVDILYGLPYILLVILFTLAFGRFVDPQHSWVVLFLAIGLVSWLTMARVVRGQVLSLKQRTFVESARSLGAGPVRVLVRHILPNVWGVVFVYAALSVPQAILQESFLSFLGIGVPPDYPTWGSLAQAVTTINTVRNDWHLIVPPCAALAVTLLSLNFVGEGLRDAFDPRRS